MNTNYDYEFLDGKVVMSRELVSMIVAHAKHKGKKEQAFAVEIIDLIYSHSSDRLIDEDGNFSIEGKSIIGK